MGKGANGFCHTLCSCLWNTLRSIPFMCLIAASVYYMGVIFVFSSTDTVFDGLKNSGFDLTAFQSFTNLSIVVMVVLNLFILLIAFFTTGWCMEKCCSRDKATGGCAKCCQSFFGIFTQYIFYLVTIASVAVFFVLVVVGLTATIISVLEKAACDTDANLTLQSTTTQENTATVKMRQYNAGSFVQMVSNMPLDSVPLLAKNTAPGELPFSDASWNWGVASQLGVRMCCGPDASTVQAIDAECAVGVCAGVDPKDDAICAEVKIVTPAEVTLGTDYLKMRREFVTACQANAACMWKRGYSSQFMKSAFDMFVGFTLLLAAQIIQLLHLQKSLAEIYAEENKNEPDSGSCNPMGDDGEGDSQPLKFTA